MFVVTDWQVVLGANLCDSLTPRATVHDEHQPGLSAQAQITLMCRDPAGRAGLSQRGSNSEIRASGRGGVNYRWCWGDRKNIKWMQSK